MGVQISVVKQLYAYFNKELVQQIDASDVGLSTIFSPKMQSRQLEPPVSLGPQWAPSLTRSPTPSLLNVGTGSGVAPCIFPRAEAQAGVACRYQDLGSPAGCALFSQILLDTWKSQDFPKPGSLSLLWITLQTGPWRLFLLDFFEQCLCLFYCFRVGRFVGDSHL